MTDLVVDNPNWQSFASGLEQDRGLAPGLLRAIAMNETGGGNPNIINQTSSAGAQGMFQFMPSTAAEHNVNVHDNADSTRGAADYLGDLTKQFGDPLLAGAAYNWGPGNLQRAQAQAAKAGLPTDAQSLAQNGYLPKETTGYVGKLAAQLQSQPVASQQATPDAGTQIQPYSPDVINATRQQVVQMTQAGASPVAIVQSLAQSPVSSMIQHLTSNGVTAQDIVSQVGGAPLQTLQAAQQKVSGQGFLTNLAAGASNAVGDLGNGIQQVGDRIAGNTGNLQQLQAQQATVEADPTRQAIDKTVGGMIGSSATKALPYAAGALLAPEGMIPALMVNGGIGATEGALTPTTGEGQFANNIMREGSIGALGAGAGHLIGTGISGMAAKALASDPEAAARIAAAQSQGLPISVASASSPNSFFRNLADGMPENSSVAGFQSQADKAVASKVADGLGISNYSGPIDTNLLTTATPQIKNALDNATNVSVTLPTTLRSDLATMLNSSKNPLTEGIETNSIVGQAAENLSKAADAGLPVSGQQLQGLSSELKNITYGSTASYGEKQLAGQLVGKIDSVLSSNMTPDQAQAFMQANSQYRNLLAVQKMVKASNDTGVVTPRQMLQAAKTGSFSNSFLGGTAPYQELAGTASDLYGPSAGKGLGSMLAKATGGDHSLAAAALLEPTWGLPALAAKKIGGAMLGKVASSQNPTLVRLLSGAGGANITPEMQAYIAKALGSVGAGTAGSIT